MLQHWTRAPGRVGVLLRVLSGGKCTIGYLDYVCLRGDLLCGWLVEILAVEGITSANMTSPISSEAVVSGVGPVQTPVTGLDPGDECFPGCDDLGHELRAVIEEGAREREGWLVLRGTLDQVYTAADWAGRDFPTPPGTSRSSSICGGGPGLWGSPVLRLGSWSGSLDSHGLSDGELAEGSGVVLHATRLTDSRCLSLAGCPRPYPLAIGFGANSCSLLPDQPVSELDYASVHPAQVFRDELVPGILSPRVELRTEGGNKPDVPLEGL